MDWKKHVSFWCVLSLCTGTILALSPSEGAKEVSNAVRDDTVAPQANTALLTGMWKGTTSRSVEVCPAGSLYAQPAQGIDDTWTFGVSDVSFPTIRYESFSGVSSDICDVHWWGCEIDYAAGLANCSPGAGDFDAIFYSDAGGMPGAVVCGYTLSVTRTFTGMTYLAGGGTIPLDVYEYSVVLPTGCTLAAGWVSIQSLSASTCDFWWLSSAIGDTSSCVDAGGGIVCGPPDQDYDLSLCLTSQCVPTFGACCLTNGDCLEVLPSDCDGTYAGLFTTCDGDCDNDGISDICELLGGAPDCNSNGLPDGCDLDSGASEDCNTNGTPDECDIAAGTSQDVNGNGVPDECDSRLFVDDDAPASGDGTTWATAFDDLQDAIDVANPGCELRVAEGTYKPDRGTGDRTTTFQLIDSVAIKGGYAGLGEPDPDERDIVAHETILSGDIGVPGDDTDNSYHVVTGDGTNGTATIDGFTITNGNANQGGEGSVNSKGGGMYNDGGSPTLVACTFTTNLAWGGAGMFNINSSPTLINCTFASNSAGTGSGGGIGNRGNSNPWAIDCRFIANSTSAGGGAILTIGDSNPVFVNSIFSGNTAVTMGGGIADGQNSVSTLTNCTLSGNTANAGGGISGTEDSAVLLTNCILWGNSDNGGQDESAQVSLQSPATATVDYSCIQGLTGGLGGTGNIGGDPLLVDADGADNIVGTEDDDLRLLPGSPCIDAGDNTAVPADTGDLDGDGDTTERTPLDLDGNPRFMDDLATVDTGVPDPPIYPAVVDMGAYELPDMIDCNGNGIHDACDVDCGPPGGSCDVPGCGQGEDCNGNAMPDECEPQDDCQPNGVQDICDIASGASADCNNNGTPDECDITSGTSEDCNINGVPDQCDITIGTSQDCNANSVPDECDITTGTSLDLDGNGVPDECEDCNGNGVLDVCDVACANLGGACDVAGCGQSEDCNSNSVPDECDVPPLLHQWASTVLDFSSQYGTSGWSAQQALGEPDTFGYGDNPTAWAPLPENGSLEFIMLGFDTPVLTNGATIRETFGNGFVYQVDILDTNDALHTVWTGVDPSQPGTPVDFYITWPRTTFLVGGVKVYVDTDHSPATWEETDAVQLHGQPESGASADCNDNGLPDECDVAGGGSVDCNSNSVPDECDLADVTSQDCNENDIPDECDILAGTSEDCQPDGVPDECQLHGGGIATATITINIFTDSYPGETTWWLVRPGLELVATGGPYNNGGTLYATDVTVDADFCYEFMIFDSYENGICCSDGNGYYEVYYEGGLIGSGGEFTSWEVVPDIGLDCADDPSVCLIYQLPDQVGGNFSDLDCDLCSTGMRILAEDFVLSEQAVIGALRLWGGYYPDSIAQDPDSFSVVFREDAAGLPGAVISAYGPMAADTKEATGLVSLGVDEYVYTFDLGQVVLGAGRFWIAIYNDTSSNSDSWFWETGYVDVAHGISWSAGSETLPEEPWSVSSLDLAFALFGPGGPPANDYNENGIPDECELDVQVVPVATLIDPATTSEVRSDLPSSIPAVVRGSSYFLEIWASDLGDLNTGLTGVYVDVAFCGESSATALFHGTVFTSFPSGTIQPGGVDEFGGSALPSGGGIEPEWVRIGWVAMSADVDIPACTVALQESIGGIAALNRGLIPWPFVDLGSLDLEIQPPARSYDLDGDGFIGVGDLSLFAGSWQQPVPPGLEAHDFDCDGFVGVGDLSWFATGWWKFVDDPTILYPPCPGRGRSSTHRTTDIDLRLLVLDTPSSSDLTTTLPTSIGQISGGQTYYLEIWVSDLGDINTGLTSTYVNVSFPEGAASVVGIFHGGIFTLFQNGSVTLGGIDELGGSVLPGGVGIEPEWARVAYVEMHADAAPASVSFDLLPSSTGVGAYGRGEIPWSDISLDSVTVGEEIPGDINNDGNLDETDIVLFVGVLLGTETNQDYIDRSDMNGSGSVDGNDLQPFVNALLAP